MPSGAQPMGWGMVDRLKHPVPYDKYKTFVRYVGRKRKLQ